MGLLIRFNGFPSAPLCLGRFKEICFASTMINLMPKWPLMPIVVMGGIALQSCAVVPQTLHTPLLQQRGQAEITAATGLHGAGVQGAYAPTDQLVLTASAQQCITKHYWAYAGEAGAGRVWRRPQSHHWAVYGGAGYGAGYAEELGFTLKFDPLSSTSRVRYGYAYLQPTYALTKKRFGLGAAVKFSQYHFTRWQYIKRYYDDSSFGNIVEVTEERATRSRGKAMTLVQPGFNLYFGLSQRLRLLASASAALPLKNGAPAVVHSAVGIGLQYRMGKQL